MVTIQDFEKLDIRIGKIVEASVFPEARNPSYKLLIDFDALGVKKSSAQITKNYTTEELVGKLVLCVTNFPPRQIGPFMSQVLTLGVTDAHNNIVLVQPEKDVPLGVKLH